MYLVFLWHFRELGFKENNREFFGFLFEFFFKDPALYLARRCSNMSYGVREFFKNPRQNLKAVWKSLKTRFRLFYSTLKFKVSLFSKHSLTRKTLWRKLLESPEDRRRRVLRALSKRHQAKELLKQKEAKARFLELISKEGIEKTLKEICDSKNEFHFSTQIDHSLLLYLDEKDREAYSFYLVNLRERVHQLDLRGWEMSAKAV